MCKLFETSRSRLPCDAHTLSRAPTASHAGGVGGSLLLLSGGTSEMIRWQCAFVLLGAIALASCSSGQFLSLTTATSPSAQTANASAPATGMPPQNSPDAASTGSIDTSAPADRPDSVGTDLPPIASVRDTIRSELFSKTEDEKPWPHEGSAEWRQQHVRDAQREQEIKERMKICRDC